MINLFHKYNVERQNGAATLMMSIVLISVITLIILFAASYAIMQQKIISNSYRYLQAYQAAEAGLEFAIPYLNQNRALITANPVGGYLAPFSNTFTQNVILANNSKYTILYTNPIANNYNLIKITVTGTSDDDSSTQTISQLVQYDSYLVTPPASSLVIKGSVSLTGTSQVINTTTNNNIVAGSTITIQGVAHTTTNNPLITSTTLGLASDVTQNNSNLLNQTENQLFMSYFGIDSVSFKNNVNEYYSNNGNTNYNSILNGKTNSIIWIDQTAGEARIDASTVIGSLAQPVILIVNGNFRMSGSAIIYGMVYVTQGTETDTIGSSNVIGAFVSAGNLQLAGNSKLTFNQNALNAVQQNMGFFAKVPGSWIDY